jgi:hypothetical protein
MSESRNTIKELECSVMELSDHTLDLRRFSEGQRYESIPYVLQDILDAQIAVNNAVKALIEETEEWKPEYLDPKAHEMMARDPDPKFIEFLNERISAREDPR